MHLPKKLSSLGLIGAAVAAAALRRRSARRRPRQASQPRRLDEVLVTARRRSESSTDVPITINVFTREDIEAAGIESPPTSSRACPT